MISLRDTLILFKPISDISFDSGVKVSVSNEDGKELFNGNMSPPDDLPKVAEQITDDIEDLAWKFIEPHEYDEIIDSQEKFDQLGDVPGNQDYLKSIFEAKRTKQDKQNERNRFIMIRTSDGNWKENFYLPPIDESHESILIVFDVQSKKSSNVNFDDKQVVVQGSTKNAFTNINGVWDTIYNSSSNQISGVRDLIAEKDYGFNLDHIDQFNFNEIKDEEKMKAAINEYLETGNVNMKWYNYDWYNHTWIRDIWLPQNYEANEGKFVTFTSEGAYGATIHYGISSLKLYVREKLIFLFSNGKWVEYSEILFSKIKYGDGFWTMKVPMEAIVPNIQFTISNSDINGVLKNVEIGAPTELLLHTIVIGMLVPAEGELENWDSKYHAEYFQQVPVSRLIVTEYEPVTLDKVVLPDGTIYTNASSDKGEWRGGDMREHIGWFLISIGINYANYGIHSTGHQTWSTTWTYPSHVAQITVHNQRGKYINGVISHGLYGGGGVATIQETVGNGLSHELGHNYVDFRHYYEFDHYLNGFKGSVHRSSEFFGSTWGWDSVRNIFLPNFEKSTAGQYCPSCSSLPCIYEGMEGRKVWYYGSERECKRYSDIDCLNNGCQKHFFGHRFLKDAMAGGWPPYPSVNSYTLHTPYALMKIQQFLESKAVFDPTSSTGMKVWNDSCKCMKEREFPDLEWIPDKTLDSSDLIKESSDLNVASMRDLLSQYSRIRITTYYNKIWIPSPRPAYIGKVIHIKNVHRDDATAKVLGPNKRDLKIRSGEELILFGKEDAWDQISDLPPGELGVDNDDDPRIPAMQRVPVATFVGYYDPMQILESYIYPALHGSYGNTFAEDSQDVKRKSSCIAKIKNAKQEALEYALLGERIKQGYMNKFHINVAESFEPTVFIIKCDGKILAKRKITGPTKDLSFTVTGRPL